MMVAGILPAPGSTVGPCEHGCYHFHCASTRQMAARVCRLCEKAIGYARRFYYDPGGKSSELVHAECLESLIDGQGG